MSVLKMMLASVGLTPESGAAYISESLGRQISVNTLRTMMKSKTSVPTDIIACLKARHTEIEAAAIGFADWIEGVESPNENPDVLIPHSHNKDDDIAKLGLAKAILKTTRSCRISQK